MDAAPSSPTDLRRGDLLSPVRGIRTLAVREYEETIEELQKENFDLKLRIFLFEKKENLKNKGPSGDEHDQTVEVAVQLKLETDNLRRELSSKEDLLNNALDQAEKYAFDLKDIQDKFVELQEQLKSVSNVRSENEWVLLKDEKEHLKSETEYLRNALTESKEQIQHQNEKIEELTNENKALEDKISRRSLAIQGLVHKYHKEAEMFPKEMRSILQGAVDAAKQNNEEEMNAAFNELKASLSKIMTTAIEEVSQETEQKENEDPLGTKKSSQELSKSSSGNYTFEESDQSGRQSDSKTKFVHASKEHSINEDNNLNQSSEPIDNYSSNSVERENFERLVNILQENETLKSDNDEKSLTIKDLNANYSELERRTIQLQSDLAEAVSKVRNLEGKIKDEKSKSTSSLAKTDAFAQTDIQWHLIQSKQSDDYLQKVYQSENVEELKEEVLRLLLLVEQKEKEVSDIDQELSDVQTKLEKFENEKNNTLTDTEDTNERHDVHQRLALSIQVNKELMYHLRKLEEFMEDLLQQKNLDTSSFQNLTTCLDETKQLSNLLSDNLSICENSKLFEGDISINREDISQLLTHSHSEDHSRLSLNASNTHPTSQGMKNFLLEPSKTTAGTGKRRLSFSTLHNSARIDPENSIFLGTSNNEDLILLLNDHGDPKDVVIRNSSQVPEWDTTMGFWNKEKSTMNQWCGMKFVRNRCPSSDSDIWSEPDRDVSLKRIGIDVQMSPVSQKSPRRSRLRDKRTTDELSSQKYESSSSAVKNHSWSKRRKSSETLRSSFISKKCASPSKDETPEKDRLQKVVNDLSNKCSKQENELDEIKGTLDAKINRIDALNKEKEELSNTIQNLNKELKELQDKEQQLTIKASKSIERLTVVNSENKKLKHTIEQLESKSSKTDITCEQLKTELKETRTRLQNLDLKCAQYEKDLSSNSQSLEEFSEKYNNVEKEKNELVNDIEKLQFTKEELLQTIQERKGRIQQFEKEIAELKEKLAEKAQSVNSLQTQYNELEAKNNELLKEKEEKESELKADLKKSQKSFENLMQTYEKESEVKKESLIEPLVNVKKSFLTNLQYLVNVCKEFLDSEEEIFKVIDDFVSRMITVNDNKIEELFSDILSVNAKFEQTIDYLSDKLSSVKHQVELDNKEIQSLKTQKSQLNAHLKTLQLTDKDSKSEIKESQSKISVLKQDLDNAYSDIKELKNVMEGQHMQVEDIQQSLQHREKSLEESKLKLSTSEVQLNNAQQQIEKDQKLLNSKDEEIDTLQQRVMSLQTRLNEVISERMVTASQTKVNANEFPQESVSKFDKGVSNTQRKSLTSETVRGGSKSGSVAGQSRASSEDFDQGTVSIVDLSKNDTNASVKSVRRDSQTEESDNVFASQISFDEFSNKRAASTFDLFNNNTNVAKVSEKTIRQGGESVKNVSATKGKIASQIRISESPREVVSPFDPVNDNTNVTKASEKTVRQGDQAGKTISASKGEVTNQIKINESAQEIASTFDPFNSTHFSNASETSIEPESVSTVRESYTPSHSSIMSLRDADYTKNREKYIKKLKSLKAKLGITEKRIEILEKEKAELREQILAQSIPPSSLSEETIALRKSLSDVKEKLQEKTAFIKELKNDMFRTCNSLIDKQKEVDNLKRKLSDNKELAAEDRSKSEDNLQKRFTDPLQIHIEENIKMLKKHKWELIQAILGQQRQFYERKNIHLGHFEKFKAYIEKLRSLQVSPSMSKAESEPLLNSFTAENNSYAEKCDRTLKNLQIELEIDVDYLQNFKIFLTRFFMPLVLQNCEQCSKHVDSTAAAKENNTMKSVSSPSKEGSENWAKQGKSVCSTWEDSRTSLSDPEEMRVGVDERPHARLLGNAAALAIKIVLIEDTFKSVYTLLENIKDSCCCTSIEETPKNIHAAKSLMMKMYDVISIQRGKLNEIFYLNSVLKSLGLFQTNVNLSRSKQDISDRESLSEEAIPLSRSGSLSPTSFEDRSRFRSYSGQSENQSKEKPRKDSQSNVAGGSRDSIFQRSHVSSPDQGIESDPNASSAPEHGDREDFRGTVSRLAKSSTKQKQWTSERQFSSTSLGSFVEAFSKFQVSDHSSASGDSLHSIGLLQHYELLKKEVHESLVGIKTVLSRTGDGMQHVIKYSSPRKNLEYSTFKAIKDKSEDIEVCLIEASKLVEKFWIAPCPSIQQLDILIQKNEEQQEKLKCLEESKMKQEADFKDAMSRLQQQEIRKLNMEKKISKKLVKTKKVIRQAEAKLLERGSQEPPLPNYPTDEPSCQL